jgi:hypothetical protein
MVIQDDYKLAEDFEGCKSLLRTDKKIFYTTK